MKTKTRNRVCGLVALAAVGMAGAAFCTNTTVKIETTMSVPRCTAVENGVQCPHQAEEGGQYCWRHRGFVKEMNDAWEKTKKWSSDTWKKTKESSSNAWDKATSGSSK